MTVQLRDLTRSPGGAAGQDARVVVVTPTVAARDHVREYTLAQWRALGYDPIVVRQDPAIPYSHRVQRGTARAAVRAGIESGADVIVYAEDDIDLDPRIWHVLPAAASETGPCSLWHRPRFRPPAAPTAGEVLIVRARQPRRWWGSQCVVLTRPLARQLLATDHGAGGIDMDLRHLPPMRITVPPLVSHRPVPRVATCGTGIDHQDRPAGESPCPG